jgi:tetratricopeptide (TPR) repeat protein
MNNDTKAAYSWYLALMGMYEDSVYFNKAKVVLQEVKDYPRMETGVYDIIALTEISRGNIAAAEEIIPIIEKINAQNLGEVNANRLLYVKARIFLAQGNYKEALNFINKVITAEQDLMQHSSGGIYYVLKAEILNYLQNFQEAYQIMTELYKKERDRSTNEYLIARILRWMQVVNASY